MVVFTAGAVIFGLGLGAISFILAQSPPRRLLEQVFNTLDPNALPDIGTLIEQRWRRIITEERYITEMQASGFNKERAESFFTTAQNILGPVEAINLVRRGEISEEEFNSIMKRNRVTIETSQQLLTAGEFLPGPADIIRFLVREVFREDIALKFGYDEDFPPEAIPEAAKIGMTEKVLKQFWRAHWELPSISLAFEMFHRLRPEFEADTPVSSEDIDTLLRIQDITPFWRERIKKVSFLLPTRVDIRRMVGVGIISPERAGVLYNQLGYPPTIATDLTNLAISDAVGSERELTRSLIEQAFKVGEIPREDAIELLQSIRYSAEESELIISVKEAAERDTTTNKQVKLLQNLFSDGFMSEDELITELDNLGVAAARRDLVVLDALSSKGAKIKMPSKDDVKLFYQKKAVTKNIAAAMLFNIGHREIDIPLYIKAWS